MKIAGWQKVSFVDYPGRIATLIFTPGCNYNCFYCHNSDLVNHEEDLIDIAEEDIFAYIKKRKKTVNALVISGGEPTLQKGLTSFINKAKEHNVSVKLDTNGSNPDVVKNLLDKQLVDYIAMDIKAPFDKYEHITGVDINIWNIKKSINIIMDCAYDYEFRTTVIPQLSGGDLVKISSYIKGAKKYVLQQYKKPQSKNLPFDRRLDKKPHSDEFFKNIIPLIEKNVPVKLRGVDLKSPSF